MSSSEPLARPGASPRSGDRAQPHEATVPRAGGGSFPPPGGSGSSGQSGTPRPSGPYPGGSGYPGTAAQPRQAPARPQTQPRSPLQPRPQPGQPGARPGRGLFPGAAGRPASAPRPQGRPAGAPRTVRLSIARVDPWSILKLSFLLSVGVGIATVICAVVLWSTVNGMGVFDDIDKFVNDISGQNPPFAIKKYIGLDNVVSLSTVIAVVNVALLTALCTLGSFLYNLASSLVGGLHVTLSDD